MNSLVLNKKLLSEHIVRNTKVKVYSINRNYVNLHFHPDFTMGGYHGVDEEYAYIPDGEIWIDQDLDALGRKATITHELLEYELMNFDNMSYEKAHPIALKAEVPILEQGLNKNYFTVKNVLIGLGIIGATLGILKATKVI